jgi:hypothetical protein
MPIGRLRTSSGKLFTCMAKENRELVAFTNHEIAPSLPVGLQYFMAIDVVTEGITPKDRIYFDILVYSKDENSPSIKILRTISHYQGGNTGKQDEIELQNTSHRVQFNAENLSDGTYVEYPQAIQTQKLDYLTDVVNMFTKLGHNNGSFIIINNKVHFVAKDGLWEKVDKNYNRTHVPELTETTEFPINRENPQLPE